MEKPGVSFSQVETENCPGVRFQLFRDEGIYHKETSPLICRANQWTGLYIIGTSSMKELSKDTGHFLTFFFRCFSHLFARHLFLFISM